MLPVPANTTLASVNLLALKVSLAAPVTTVSTFLNSVKPGVCSNNWVG